MDSHVFRKASYRLPALADLAVLRFNTAGSPRPRGTSEGTFDNADAERFDVAAAIEYAEFHEDPPLPNRWLVGWSFGTDLALMYGLDPSIAGRDPAVARRCGSPRPEHLAAWAASGKPVVALVPELDDYLRPAEARERFAASRRPRSSGSTAPSTSGWGSRRCAACSTRSSRASPPAGSRCRTPGTAR